MKYGPAHRVYENAEVRRRRVDRASKYGKAKEKISTAEPFLG